MPLIAPSVEPQATLTAAEKAELLARIDHLQSVGASILSNATLIRQAVESLAVEG
jgi:hypothetical protein